MDEGKDVETPIDAAAREKPKPKSEKEEVKPSKDEKKVEKVVTGPVKEQKPSLGERMKDIFFSGDFGGAARYVATEVLLPAMRNLIVDTVSTAVERAVYGETRRRPRSANEPRGRYRYDTAPGNRPPDRRGYVPDQPLPATNRHHAGVNDILLVSREEAEMVIERMSDIISQYDVVSVADLKELCGLPNHYVDNTWGWHSVAQAVVRQTRDGYLLIMPAEEAL